MQRILDISLEEKKQPEQKIWEAKKDKDLVMSVCLYFSIVLIYSQILVSKDTKH